ncbi:MAG: plasmid maintenance system antidote protein [Sphingobacteriales bacterium]|nr:plasmid maintenance system antidote protein [Sphingobacteriales bacterium]
MKRELDILKGLHPGIVLDRKIREQRLKKGQLALDCHEYPQTLTAITKGKRDMNTRLSLKLEKTLGLEEGYFMMLQIFYDISQEKKRQVQAKPDLSKFRRILFWDTRMELIDWDKHAGSVIRRIFERGNQKEKEEITRFYGEERIKKALKDKP